MSGGLGNQEAWLYIKEEVSVFDQSFLVAKGIDLSKILGMLAFGGEGNVPMGGLFGS